MRRNVMSPFGFIPTRHTVTATGPWVCDVWSRVGKYEIIKSLLLNLWSLFFEREEA